jgi:hypothetical protein
MARKPRVTAHKIAEDVKIAPLAEASEDRSHYIVRVETVNREYPPHAVRVNETITRCTPTKLRVNETITRCTLMATVHDQDAGMKVTVTGVDDPDSGAGDETSFTKRKP